jgi:hypothetical protein
VIDPGVVHVQQAQVVALEVVKLKKEFIRTYGTTVTLLNPEKN